MTERRVLSALVVLLIVGALVFGWLFLTAPTDPVVVRAPEPPRAKVRARPSPSPGRVSLPRPAAPEPAGTRPRLDPNTKYSLNDHVDQVVRAAREECLLPYVNGVPDPHELEFVLDVVLVEGDATDFGVRVPGGEALPTEVVACMADAVWAVDWPHFDGTGPETRLQRDFTVSPTLP